MSMPQPIVPEQPLPAASTNEPAVSTPWRLLPALAIGALLTAIANSGSLTVLIPALIAQVDAARKVELVAAVSVAGALVALVFNVIVGALSDMTTSRFGRRAPWIVGGAVGSVPALILLGMAPNGAAAVLAWCAFQMFLAAMLAPMAAAIADRVPPARKGVFSTAWGTGLLVGGAGGFIIGGPMVLTLRTGFAVFAGLAFAGGIIFVVISADAGNTHESGARSNFSKETIRHHFSFPRRGARDLYLALGGKLMQVIASNGVVAYTLYMLTDYMQVDLGSAGLIGAQGSLLGLPLAVVLGVACGILSDRLGRRKIFVIGSALVAAAAMLFPLLVPQVWAFLVYAVITSAALGVYFSVDQALNTEVLPSQKTAAKDLGIVNMATTGGIVLGPALVSLVVTIGGYPAMFVTGMATLLLSAMFIAPIRKAR